MKNMILMFIMCLASVGCTTTRNVFEYSPEGMKWEMVHQWDLGPARDPIKPFKLELKYDGVYTSTWPAISGRGTYSINRSKHIITIDHPSAHHSLVFLYDDKHRYLTLVLVGIKDRDDGDVNAYGPPFGFIMKNVD